MKNQRLRRIHRRMSVEAHRETLFRLVDRCRNLLDRFLPEELSILTYRKEGKYGIVLCQEECCTLRPYVILMQWFSK